MSPDPRRRRAGPLAAAVLLTLAACGSPAATPVGTTTAPSTAATLEPSAPATAPATDTPAPSAAGLPSSGTWARLEVAGAGPAAREDHTWTVDPDAGVAYLFGGRGGGRTFADLWAFDLATDSWRRLDPPGATPDGRFGHQAAWVPGMGLVVTLGQVGTRFFDDVWLFDPAAGTWRELPGAGQRPVARYGSCAGIGPDGRLWISHGFTAEGTRFFDTRAYDLAAERWVDLTPSEPRPVKRCLHACWWTADGSLVLYGGQTNGVAALGDLWRLAPASGDAGGTWTKLADPDAPGRILPAAARPGAYTIVFGGRDGGRRALRDTWLLPDTPDPTGAPAVRLAVDGGRPAARWGAELVHDAARDRLLLFGGTAREAFADLWVLTLD